MRGQAFIAASALAIVMIAQPASAQYRNYQDAHIAQYQDCQHVPNGRTVGGAVIGGVAGAVVGSHVGARGHHSDGGLLGAALGAFLGGSIGHNSAQNSQACSGQVQGNYDPYYGQAQGGQYGQYADSSPYPGSDNYRSNDGYNGDRDCRMGTETFRDPNGRQYSENVMMCRGDDGVWRPDR